MAKKKKAATAEAAVQQDDAGEQPSTSGRGRSYTVSMAVPGSMIDNTQNIEFATFVAGQVGNSRHRGGSCHQCVTSAWISHIRSELAPPQSHLQLSNSELVEFAIVQLLEQEQQAVPCFRCRGLKIICRSAQHTAQGQQLLLAVTLHLHQLIRSRIKFL
jgi:hypothetical protein